ncbi:malonate decarboxylase holo-ACP synthase [Paenibacillus oralis]|nr:malonate decarboxylase holo-ACP synthase [Paenibacillus oralis]
MVMTVRPHDLIEVADLSCLSMNEDKEWAAASLRHAPYVVVRRASPPADSRIPVGIRGTERNQREAALLAPEGAGRIVTPYEIAERRMWNAVSVERRDLPVIRVMDKVAELMADWRWGPAGSAGFEMATGCPSLKVTSDLDLVIDRPEAVDYAEAANLLRRLDQLEVRIDIQLETKDGAYVLREIIDRRTSTVVLRCPSGPKLVRNPWK